MYTPPAYAESSVSLLRQRMREWPFATLVTSGPKGLNASHLPFVIETETDGRTVLVTHLARANAQCEDLQAGARALVIFQGPHAFVSPGWYVDQQTFPTWNYVAIHAQGHPTLVEDDAELYEILKMTVAEYDTPHGGAWRFEAMPEHLVSSRLRAIVGLRIAVERIEGKMKLNQDRSVADRLGVVAALEHLGEPQGVAIAQLIRSQPDMIARDAAAP